MDDQTLEMYIAVLFSVAANRAECTEPECDSFPTSKAMYV